MPRIIRFLDDTGTPLYGVPGPENTAHPLPASPLQGPIRPAYQTRTIHKLLPPIEVTNIFCIGLNYRQHAEEMNSPLPEHPVVFMKPTTAVVGSGDPIVIPACCTHGDEVDYECELAVVIGKAGRDIPESRALEHVLGYTCGNDVSARRWQKHGGGGQWVRGKSFDTFCPLGPCLVTADEIPDPQTLRITTTLNGQVMQDSTTADMIFPVAKLIAFLSQDTTLLPGTVILTGTPSGVGMGRKPPLYLKDGDEVMIEIERIGKLTNPVRAAAR